VPRPAILVAMVTAPLRPAWAIISASRAIDSGLAFRTSCLTPSAVSLSEKACDASTEVVPTSTGRPDRCMPISSLSAALDLPFTDLYTALGRSTR